MNETSILSRDIYGLVNQLSDWGCFDSKLSVSPCFFPKNFKLNVHSNICHASYTFEGPKTYRIESESNSKCRNTRKSNIRHVISPMNTTSDKKSYK